jgi:single-stranded-DNA-specific exonuclease
VRALLRVAGRDPASASTFDLGFAAGPRLNAAGRLADMGIGIECLFTDDPARALNIARQLDALNQERRLIEADMQDQASELLDRLDATERASLVLYDPSWHQGVVGLLASRVMRDQHRPVIAFARSGDGLLRGSGRSIPVLHLRDALDRIAKRHPRLIPRFGGHAAAAGLTLREDDLNAFERAFEEVARDLLGPADLLRRIETDGAVEGGHLSLQVARLIDQDIWGQGFPAPLFDDRFEVENQRLVKGKHLKLTLRRGRARLDAIRFNHREPAPRRLHAAFRIAENEFNGASNVQLVVEHFEEV